MSWRCCPPLPTARLACYHAGGQPKLFSMKTPRRETIFGRLAAPLFANTMLAWLVSKQNQRCTSWGGAAASPHLQTHRSLGEWRGFKNTHIDISLGQHCHTTTVLTAVIVIFLPCFLPSLLSSFLPSFLPYSLLPSFLASFRRSFLPSEDHPGNRKQDNNPRTKQKILEQIDYPKQTLKGTLNKPLKVTLTHTLKGYR